MYLTSQSTSISIYLIWEKYKNSASLYTGLLLFSRSVVSDSLQLHGMQHARLPCPAPSPGACSNSCPLTQWCHPTIILCRPLPLYREGGITKKTQEEKKSHSLWLPLLLMRNLLLFKKTIPHCLGVFSLMLLSRLSLVFRNLTTDVPWDRFLWLYPFWNPLGFLNL